MNLIPILKCMSLLNKKDHRRKISQNKSDKKSIL